MIALLPFVAAWSLMTWNGSYAAIDAPGIGQDLATFNFPTNIGYTPFAAFLVTTDPLPNLVGKTVQFTFTIETTDDPTFRFGGQDSWNFGPRPAGCTVFLSSQTGYSQEQYDACPTCFWFFDPTWTDITPGGTFTVSVNFNGNAWSDTGTSNNGATITQTESLRYVLQNPAQLGLAFGGGDFFDVGVALVNIGGAATFHLTGFQITDTQPFGSRLSALGSRLF